MRGKIVSVCAVSLLLMVSGLSVGLTVSQTLDVAPLCLQVCSLSASSSLAHPCDISNMMRHYAGSKFLETAMTEATKEHEKAKAAGDTKRVKELEAWGEKQHRKLHRQGFGRAPVDDILAHVKDKFPEVACKTGVNVIAWQ